MTSTAPLSRPAPLDKLLVGLSFVLGLATIGGAWASQLLFGLVPCELCLEQRVAYYWGLPLLALVLILWNRLPLQVWYVAVAAATAIFVWSIYMGGFHSGVEWGFWPGPTACSGLGGELSFNDLSNLEAVIPCDKVQFRFLGISLAGYNALISLVIVAMLLAAMVFQWKRSKA